MTRKKATIMGRRRLDMEATLGQCNTHWRKAVIVFCLAIQLTLAIASACGTGSPLIPAVLLASGNSHICTDRVLVSDFQASSPTSCLPETVGFPCNSPHRCLPALPVVQEGVNSTLSGLVSGYFNMTDGTWTESSVCATQPVFLNVTTYWGTLTRSSPAFTGLLGQVVCNISHVTRLFAASTITGSSVALEGQLQDVITALGQLQYYAGMHVNSLRMAWDHEGGLEERLFPNVQRFESLSVKTIRFGEHLQHQHQNASSEFLIRISPVNGKPILEKQPPAALCVQQSGTFEQRQAFGDFFLMEGDILPRALCGVSFSDEDVLEGCSGSACNQKTMQVEMLLGTNAGKLSLNARTGLEISTDTSRFISFSGTPSAVLAAVKAINIAAYDGSTTSVIGYHSQLATTQQSLTVSVSDQGNTGADGLSQSDVITVPLLVVAVNNAPEVVVSKPNITVIEDTQGIASGIRVTDIDIHEVIRSWPAQQRYLASPAVKHLLNKISVTLSSEKGGVYTPYISTLSIFQSERLTCFTIADSLTLPWSAMVAKNLTTHQTLTQSLLSWHTQWCSVCLQFTSPIPVIQSSSSEWSCGCQLFSVGTATPSACIDNARAAALSLSRPLSEIQMVSPMEKVSLGLAHYQIITEGVESNLSRTCGGEFQGSSCVSDTECATRMMCTPKELLDDNSDNLVNSTCVCCDTPSISCMLDSDCISGTCGCRADKPSTYSGPRVKSCDIVVSIVPGSPAFGALVDLQDTTGSHFLSFSGPINNLNFALDNLKYIGDKDVNSITNSTVDSVGVGIGLADTIKVTVQDNGNGDGWDYKNLKASGELVVLIDGVNDAPSVVCDGVNSASGGFLNATEGASLPFNVCRVEDPDFLDADFLFLPMTLELSALHGTLNVSNVNSISISSTGAESSTTTIQCTFAECNLALKNAVYTPAKHFNTEENTHESIKVLFRDGGVPELTGSNTVPVSVQAVNTPPRIGINSLSGFSAIISTVVLPEDLDNTPSQASGFWLKEDVIVVLDDDVLADRMRVVATPNSGKLKLQMEATHGTLTLAPIGQKQFPSPVQFFLPSTAFLDPCPTSVCGVSQRRIECIIPYETLRSVQTDILIQGLRYQPGPDFVGVDFVNITAIDDISAPDLDHYKTNGVLQINITAVNDAPRLVFPSTVLAYPKGRLCEAGNCPRPGESAFPPAGTSPLAAIVDVDALPGDPMNLEFRVEVGGGELTFDSSIRSSSEQVSETGLGLESTIQSLASLTLSSRTITSPSLASTEFSEYSQSVQQFGSKQFNVYKFSGTIQAITNSLQHIYFQSPEETGYYPVVAVSSDGIDTNEVLIDIIVTGAQECDLFSDCDTCVAAERCGWCPGRCGGAGKCMEGPSSPSFETCPAHFADGRQYNQCNVVFANSLYISLGSAAAIVAFLFFWFFGFKYIRRRHGKARTFLQGKVFSAVRAGRKIHIVPPEDAHYFELIVFGVLVAVGVTIYSLLTRSTYQSEEFYLTNTSNITFNLDGCSLRFLPPEEYRGPRSLVRKEGQLGSVMMAIDLMKHPLVELKADDCGRGKIFTVINDRLDSFKYLNYKCDILLFVPKGTVLPDMIVNSVGTQPLTFRGGPVDLDSAEMGVLSFGPSKLLLTGTRIDATLDMLQCREFNFTADSGSLAVSNLDATNTVINTKTAIIDISTENSVSLDYVQPSGLACLTSFEQTIRTSCVQNTEFPPRVLENLTAIQSQPGCEDGTCELIESVCRANCSGSCFSNGTCITTICSGIQNADLVASTNALRTVPMFVKTDESEIHVRASGGINSEKTNQRVGRGAERTIDISQSDKISLDETFHAGGRAAPSEKWVWIRFTGAGVPGPSQGMFVFANSITTFVMPRALLDVVSLSLLTADTTTISLSVLPSFCPSGSGSAVTTATLEDLFRAFISNVENPPLKPEVRLPAGSIVGFLNTSTLARQVFRFSPDTGEIEVIDVSVSNFPTLVLLIALAIVIPVLVGLLTSIICLFRFKSRLEDYRYNRLKEAAASESLLDSALDGDDAGLDDEDWEPDPKEENKLRARVSLFYLLEDAQGAADKAVTRSKQIKVVFNHVVLILTPAVPLLLFSNQYESTLDLVDCEFRTDNQRCRAGRSLPVVFVESLVVTWVVVGVLELIMHFLRLGPGKIRFAVRKLFYVIYFVVGAMATMYVTTVSLWTILGVMVNPAKVMPYATAIIGLITHAASLYAKLKKIQVKIQKEVTKRVVLYKSKMKGTLPDPVLDIIMGKNISAALEEAGFSMSKVMLAVAGAVFMLLLIFAFLFVGFNAFTDPTDLGSGAINSGMTGGAAVGANQSAAGDSNDDAAKEEMEEQSASIGEKIERILNGVMKQIQNGMKMLNKMKKQLGAFAEAGEALADAGKDVYKAKSYSAKQKFKMKKDIMRQAVLEKKYNKAMGSHDKQVEVSQDQHPQNMDGPPAPGDHGGHGPHGTPGAPQNHHQP